MGPPCYVLYPLGKVHFSTSGQSKCELSFFDVEPFWLVQVVVVLALATTCCFLCFHSTWTFSRTLVGSKRRPDLQLPAAIVIVASSSKDGSLLR